MLVIVSDDAEMRDLGSYGGDLPTPNLDRIVAEGTGFTNAYAASTVCTPSRYTLLTGRYPTRSSSFADVPRDARPNRTWSATVGEGDRTIVGPLNDLGYRTGFVG